MGDYERALTLTQDDTIDLSLPAHTAFKSVYNAIGAFEEALKHGTHNTKALR